MIVVQVSIWPHGRKEDARELERFHIINDGTGDKEFGNYRIECGPFDGVLGMPIGSFRRFRRRYGVLALVSRALKTIGYV
jgi:hypothetical protein